MPNILGKSAASNVSLQMDFWSEKLSEVQNAYYSKAEKEYDDIMTKVAEFIAKEKGTVLEHGTDVVVLEGPTGATPSVLNSVVTPVSQPLATLPKGRLIPIQAPSPQQVPNLQAAVSSPQLIIHGGPVPSGARVTRATQPQPTTTFQGPQIQLVMDPRLSFIVGTPIPSSSAGNQVMQPPPASQTPIPQQTIAVQPTPVSSASAQPLQLKARVAPIAPRSLVKPTTMTTSSSQATGSVPSITDKQSGANALHTSNIVLQKTGKGRNSTSSFGGLAHTTIPTSVNKPTENNSVGGLSAGNANKKDAQDEVKNHASGPDSREVTFNKLAGKTFPSLVVLARPHLKLRDMGSNKITQERSGLDGKVKCVLMHTTTKFSEWLIQQGLVRSEQFCSVHSDSSGPLNFKLGMYSDVSKFPFSGGYVWVSECCPQKFVSLFSGSIFESAPHPPTVLLKLMYHWCCQTNVQNVIQWVKVDNFYVKNFFTHMRSICIAAVHEKHEKLGGHSKKVEVGVISLGTTSQDGNMRQVKVEVLGVMDTENRMVRLRAVEPLQDGERNYKRRFVKILEPLKHWVHTDSIILTDFTVDKGTLVSMGFTQVHQSTIPDPPSAASKLSNQNIMEYLRRIVPRMFQNTLSLLSRQIIQQFLDELVWRERWGIVPSYAFDTLVSHLASQTKLDTGESLITKLGKIASNPFRNWAYEYWKIDGLIAPESGVEPSSTLQSTSSLTLATHVSSVRSKVAEGASKSGEAKLPEDTDCRPSIAVTKKYDYIISEEVERQVFMAIQKIDKGLSLRTAIKLSKVPRSAVLDRARDVLKTKMASGSAVFTEDEEADIQDHLMTLHEWGYLFGRWDIRLVVHQYLNTCGRVELRFKDNFPGDMWIERFLSRHPILSEKLCRNIPSRGKFIDTASIKQFILKLSSVITSVQAKNVINFMEIGLTGDPLKSMTVELRESRYPVGKRKVKSAAAVMIACTGEGEVLPSYVVFEGKSVVTATGQFPGEYYGTKTGWFDETSFQYWLETVIFPWADSLSGNKVLIGDNLAQLFTLKTLAHCVDKNITFVSMPCNVSNFLSPLAVILCEKLRSQWRNRTRAWASANSDKYITLEEFPDHIFELMASTLGPEIPDLLRVAFKHVGLYPFNTRNIMKALENGGISLTENDQNQSEKESKKKRMSTDFDDFSAKKKHIKEPTVIEEVVIDDDHEKDVAFVGKALKSEKDLIKLDSYYYGTKKPAQEHLNIECKSENLNARCPMCQTCVPDNITLMRHIFGHSDKEPNVDEVSSVHLCRYCATTFSTSDELDKHIKKIHVNLSSHVNACLICSEKMKDRVSLILHMQNNHSKLELPYVCNICFFRSSEQHKLVDHFYESHAGGEKIQCPFCLKCVAISNMGKKLTANIIFFMHHVKKHQNNDSSRKCEKCALYFVHRGILKTHLATDHIGHDCDPSVLPYDDNSAEAVMMPVPRETGVKVRFSRKIPLNIFMHGVMPQFKCIECHGNISEGIHFTEYMQCGLCSFATCCGVSMRRHFTLFHSKSRPSSAVLHLPQEVYCMCGFKAQDGNVIANHLARCVRGRGTAYTSEVAAKTASDTCQQSASFPPLISLEETPDPSEQWMKAFSSKKDNEESNNGNSSQKDPSNMLDVLGLIRKSSLEECTEKAALSAETEEESSRDGHSSRMSSSSNSSYKRKRSAQEADCGSYDVQKKACLNDSEDHEKINSLQVEGNP